MRFNFSIITLQIIRIFVLLFIIYLAIIQATTCEGYNNRRTMESDYLKTISTLLDQIRASTNVSAERKVQLTQDLLAHKIGLSQVRLALSSGLDNSPDVLEDGKTARIKSINEFSDSPPYVAGAIRYDDSPVFHRDDDDKTDIDLVYKDVIYHEDSKNLEETTMIRVKNRFGEIEEMPWSNAVRTTPLYDRYERPNYVPSYADSIRLSQATQRARLRQFE